MATLLPELTVSSALYCGTATAFLVYILNRIAFAPYNYWKRRGVRQADVEFPIVGNLIAAIRKPVHELSAKTYNDFPNERFVGTYIGTKPSLLIRDPELVESVLVKDFSHVSDRGTPNNPKDRLGKHLLNLGEDHWKSMRNKLTPTFSSGKLKGMHSQLIDCGSSLMKFMKTFEDGKPFEVRDVISRFTMDVIASCAFGLNIDTINDPDSEFRKMGLTVFKPTPMAKFLFMLRIFPYWVSSFFRKIFSKNSSFIQFFIDAVDSTIEYRKTNKISRPDFLQLMNELKAKEEEMIKKKELDPNHPHLFDHHSLVSNAFVFFLAGFETTATTMSYTMYEFAMNPDVQERAHAEVAKVMKTYGQPTYEAIQEMNYLEMCLQETLRKYPPASAISRKVTQDYRLPGTDTVLNKGTHISIPTYALHHDPQYYPDPERYIPERFDEAKNTVQKNTYLPFGGGPRICIGARFAKVEAKVGLTMILNEYKIVKCEKTRNPLKFDKNAFLLVPEGGIWVSLQPRTKN